MEIAILSDRRGKVNKAVLDFVDNGLERCLSAVPPLCGASAPQTKLDERPQRGIAAGEGAGPC